MLIRAFARVASQIPDVDLLLAGDGPLRGQLTAQVTQLGIAGRVQFLGVRGDVPDILRAADVFALTSIAEAASITLLEAMASGLPSSSRMSEAIRKSWTIRCTAFWFLVATPRPPRRRVWGAPHRPAAGGSNGSCRSGQGSRTSQQLDTTVATYYARYQHAVASLRRQLRYPPRGARVSLGPVHQHRDPCQERCGALERCLDLWGPTRRESEPLPDAPLRILELRTVEARAAGGENDSSGHRTNRPETVHHYRLLSPRRTRLGVSHRPPRR